MYSHCWLSSDTKPLQCEVVTMKQTREEMEAEFIDLTMWAKGHDVTVYNFIVCMLLESETQRNGSDADCILWNYLRTLSRGALKRVIKICRQGQKSCPARTDVYENCISLIREHLLKQPT